MQFEEAIPGHQVRAGRERQADRNWGDRDDARATRRRGWASSSSSATGSRRARVPARRQDGSEPTQRPRRRASNGQRVPRRDLELEALAEILAGKRLSPLPQLPAGRDPDALPRRATSSACKIGDVPAHARGLQGRRRDRQARRPAASCFSDWWAYKFEVYDAIPYDGAIMHEQGVVVSFNSDADELARRLNLEAAKAVKYGGSAAGGGAEVRHAQPGEAAQASTSASASRAGQGRGPGRLVRAADLERSAGCEATYVDGRRATSPSRRMRPPRDDRDRAVSRLIQKMLADRGAAAATAGGRGRRRRPGRWSGAFGGRRRPPNEDRRRRVAGSTTST